MLACCADSTKLKPLLIFKRKTIPKENFPRSVVIWCNEKGWCNEDIILDWFQEVWKKREGAFFNSKGVLITDSMRAHIKNNVKAEAKKTIGAELSIIPGGLTKILQPQDISVNRSFKSRVRACWENWMSEGLHTCTKGGNMKCTSYTEVAECVHKSWKSVKVSTI
ncbi:pogo transposable element with KRAB domain [Trichonephila clavipes]|nr:pogo transposable element with KRAB domain [Trichonephila clavipes]